MADPPKSTDHVLKAYQQPRTLHEGFVIVRRKRKSARSLEVRPFKEHGH